VRKRRWFQVQARDLIETSYSVAITCLLTYTLNNLKIILIHLFKVLCLVVWQNAFIFKQNCWLWSPILVNEKKWAPKINLHSRVRNVNDCKSITPLNTKWPITTNHKNWPQASVSHDSLLTKSKLQLLSKDFRNTLKLRDNTASFDSLFLLRLTRL